MNKQVKSDDLLYIENCFAFIKRGVSIQSNLTKIESTINRVFDLNVHIEIIKNTSSVFFGMNIFPEVDTMDKMVNNIVSRKCTIQELCTLWEKNNNWYIEIDSLLFDDNGVNANPQEMVAVLLHEIGHVIYSNSVPHRMYKILSYKIIKLKYSLRQLIENEKIRKIFNIAIIESCSISNFKYENKHDESSIDKIVVHYGYGEELESFINKLLKTQGNSLINRTDDEIDKDVESIINWSIVNVTELEIRKRNLREALKVEILKTPSRYVKRVIQDIYTTFFGDVTDKYRELLSEQYMAVPKDVYQEAKNDQILVEFVTRIVNESTSKLFDKHGKLKKVTQTDIDIITVEAEKIDTVDDKIYLLDKLYRYLNLVNMGLDYIESGDKKLTPKITQSKTTLQSMKKQLEDLRDQIMATRIIEKDYGVFIRYPKGYQG